MTTSKVFLFAAALLGMSLLLGCDKDEGPESVQPVPAVPPPVSPSANPMMPAGAPPVPGAIPGPAQVADALNFTMTGQDGKEYRLSDYIGKIVVLEWTNPECPYVVRHYNDDHQTMIKLAKEYKDKGVVWMAVNSTSFHDQADNKAFHDAKQLPYPVLDDHVGAVGHLFGARTTPHMFIINKQGRLVYQGAIDSDPRGEQDDPTNYVRQALDQLLAGKEVDPAETKPYGCSVKYAE